MQLPRSQQVAIVALGIALGNTAEALAGARLTRHALGDPPEFWSVDGVFRFVLLAALLPPLLSAGCGVVSLHGAGVLPAAQVAETALTWFTGNVAGILTFTPLFLIGSPPDSRRKITRRALAEGLLVLVFLVFLDLEHTASKVTISVTDEGPGIPKRDRAPSSPEKSVPTARTPPLANPPAAWDSTSPGNWHSGSARNSPARAPRRAAALLR
jgi:hypothetical protein